MTLDKESARRYQRNLRKTRREQGLCVRCGGLLTDERISCANCAKKENSYVQKVVKRNLSEGKCRCGHTAILTKRTCERCLGVSRDILRNLKLQVINGYGGKCVCCGITKWEFLSVDHVTERGCDERRRLRHKTPHSNALYTYLIKNNFPSTHQILCYNCNMSLGFFGYCPHHPEIRREVKKG